MNATGHSFIYWVSVLIIVGGVAGWLLTDSGWYLIIGLVGMAASIALRSFTDDD